MVRQSTYAWCSHADYQAAPDRNGTRPFPTGGRSRRMIPDRAQERCSKVVLPSYQPSGVIHRSAAKPDDWAVQVGLRPTCRFAAPGRPLRRDTTFDNGCRIISFSLAGTLDSRLAAATIGVGWTHCTDPMREQACICVIQSDGSFPAGGFPSRDAMQVIGSMSGGWNSAIPRSQCSDWDPSNCNLAVSSS